MENGIVVVHCDDIIAEQLETSQIIAGFNPFFILNNKKTKTKNKNKDKKIKRQKDKKTKR